MNKHNNIYELIASRRRELGLSQQELAERAGMRREKVNRFESQRIDIGISEIFRLLDVVGLVISIDKKPSANERRPRKVYVNSHGLAPGDLESESFFDGSKAAVVNWGKVPR